ncbi:MAG: ester cyclase [Oscillospiraceae bacterium]|nr:ester cyclase [Oscillospiraceae bacterium]
MDNKILVRDFFTAAYTNRDSGFVMRHFTPHYTDHSPLAARSSAQAAYALSELYTQLNPIRASLVHMAASGDIVAVLVSFTAVHSGPFMGVAPTGRTLRWQALEHFRIENGQIAESWGAWPDTQLYAQLTAR